MLRREKAKAFIPAKALYHSQIESRFCSASTKHEASYARSKFVFMNFSWRFGISLKIRMNKNPMEADVERENQHYLPTTPFLTSSGNSELNYKQDSAKQPGLREGCSCSLINLPWIT